MTGHHYAGIDTPTEELALHSRPTSSQTFQRTDNNSPNPSVSSVVRQSSSFQEGEFGPSINSAMERNFTQCEEFNKRTLEAIDQMR